VTGYANSYPAFADGPRAHTSWYVYDGLGSVVGTVDGKSLAYTPGPKRDVYGNPRDSATLPTPNGFVGALGHPTDLTGLIYMRARYYDPQTGRFISEDPQQNDNNFFVYAGNDPVNNIDSSGCRKKRIITPTSMEWQALAITAGLMACLMCYFQRGSGPINLGLAIAFGEESVFCYAMASGKTPEEAASFSAFSLVAEVCASVLVGEDLGTKVAWGGAAAFACMAIAACANYDFDIIANL